MTRVPMVMTITWNEEETRSLKDQNLRSLRENLNRFQKKVSVDFHAARAFDVAARDQFGNLLDIVRRRTIFFEG